MRTTRATVLKLDDRDELVINYKAMSVRVLAVARDDSSIDKQSPQIAIDVIKGTIDEGVHNEPTLLIW